MVSKNFDPSGDAAERLGVQIDRLDNLVGALSLPLRDEMHVEQLRLALPEVVKEMKNHFAKLTGENPWKDHP